MRVKSVLKRLLASFLCVGMVLSYTPVTAFATDTSEPASSAVTTDNQESQEEVNVPQKDVETPESANPPDSEASEEESTSNLSAEAQAFVDAVNALNSDEIILVANNWGLANKAWLENVDNSELTQALDEATAKLDEVQNLFVQCEDLYSAISEDEKNVEEVAAAYDVFSNIYMTAMNATMYPTDPNDSSDESEGPSSEEITNVLFGDFPHAPSDYYIGEGGLPVPVGETVFSISGWKNELYDGSGRFDADALNAGGSDVTVAKVDGQDYAIVPILVQVEYPDSGSTIHVDLPENVEVVSYNSLSDKTTPMDETEKNELLTQTLDGSAGSVFGFYVKATQDFDASVTYTDAEGQASSHSMHVTVSDSQSDEGLITLQSSQDLANTPSLLTVAGGNPPFTSGKITKIKYNSALATWLIWFNGMEAYCCDHGLNGQPSGCPNYSMTDTSKVDYEQYTPGDHAGNQVRIWGGLGQLSLMSVDTASTYSLTSEEEVEETFYDETQQWIIDNYPDSEVAQIYTQSAAEAVNGGVSTYAGGDGKIGYYSFIYTPARSGWQRVAVVTGEEISGDVEIPDGEGEGQAPTYNGSWSVSVTESATASDSFTYTYTINANKYQLDMLDKVQDAVLSIEPVEKGGTIDGGTWSINPATAQTITTSAHEMNDNFNSTGGQGTVSFTVTYNVTKSATATASGSGNLGPFTSQEELDAAKQQAEQNAHNNLSNQAKQQAQNDANNQVAAAIAAAKAQLQTLQFTFKETSVPYGYKEWTEALGSNQTITVNQGANEVFDMINDEWEINVVIDKVDSETGNQIATDTEWSVYEWDKVSQSYVISDRFDIVRNGHPEVLSNGEFDTSLDYPSYTPGQFAPEGMTQVGYNLPEEDGKYYAVCKTNGEPTLYYTQRNEGKFIIVEQTAPEGYYGDWTDLENPGNPNTILGKRAYYIEITETNDESTINLDNKDYNADIATSYTGGTKIVDGVTGAEATVTISKASEEPAAEITYLESGRTYVTDKSGKGYNEDSYTMTPKDDVFQNDRVLGEISISKVDLEAERYVDGSAAHGTAIESGQKHGDATLDGAVYDLYAAQDIYHPDGVSGIVDYSKLTYADGSNIWHTTVLENSGAWNSNYLPVLEKDHLVASAKIEDGWLTFSNLYMGAYYIVERGTGVTIPVTVGGAYYVDGTYPTIDERTKKADGGTAALAKDRDMYTDYVYKNQFSNISVSKALDGTKVYDGYYQSFAEGYLCDEKNYYFPFEYAGEGSYIEKYTFGNRSKKVTGNVARMAESATTYDLTITPPYVIDNLGTGYDEYYSQGESLSAGLDTTTYGNDVLVIKWDAMTETRDQVAKTNIEIGKHSSDTGSSDGYGIEGAGFTLYLISDLTKADQIEKTPDGKYDIDSLIDLYINTEYDNEQLKYDFTGETQAIAKTYEIDANLIAEYNKTLTPEGDNKNGSGEGWVATGNKNEYQLSELFSNEDGVIGISGLPYGQYVVVETTTPEDRWQAAPFIIDVDASLENNPESVMGIPNYGVLTPSDANQNFRYNINDEAVEMYLRIWKKDVQTGKNVLREGTAFQIYWMNEDGTYMKDDDGNPRLVTMTATQDGSVAKKVDTFYTTEEGTIALPEKLPIGHYRLVEVEGPEGFYNEWIDTAQYGENGILLEEGSGSYYVDFEVTTDRIYWATGDDNEDEQDTLVIEETYWNNETLGIITIRKLGEVLTGWEEDETDELDPQFSGHAIPGHFTYETRPLAGAVYEIRAAEDIVTQDNQKDENGNRTLWYKKGDLVATVTTGDGTSDINVFGPLRTIPTYDFLSVIHDGSIGEVSVTLPLGTYTIQEIKPPYGYVLNDQVYTVELTWDNQTNDIVLASSISLDSDEQDSWTHDYEVVNVGDATEEQIEEQVLTFYNAREYPTPEESGEKVGIGVYKRDIISGDFVAGAVFNLYTDDDIYDADGNKIFSAGDLVATSPATDANGFTYFDKDVPIRGENYEADLNAHKDTIGYVPAPENGKYDATWNSGNYTVVEIVPPEGYFLEDTPMHVSFTYDGQVFQVVQATNINMPTITYISKKDLTNDEELPGATLQIKDSEGNIFKEWVSTDTPERILGLHFDEEYTLVETRAADGYALASDITFKVVRVYDEETGDELKENDVYYKDDKGEWQKLDDDTVIMKDDITKVEISKKDITNEQELPGAHLVIKDHDGNVVEEWTSTNEPHYIEKLPAGDYTLTEITAPEGYEIANSINFTVYPTGEIQHVVMYDRPDEERGILIHKVDAETHEPIEGIHFQILDRYTKEVVAYNITNDVGNIWFGLPDGDYYYQEIKWTPEYSGDSTLHPFSINDENTEIYIEYENERSPIYGIITWFKDKFGNNYKTGDLPNGTGTEGTPETAETAGTDTSVSVSTNLIVVAIGAILVVVGVVVIVITSKKKGKNDTKSYEEDGSEDESSPDSK